MLIKKVNFLGLPMAITQGFALVKHLSDFVENCHLFFADTIILTIDLKLNWWLDLGELLFVLSEKLVGNDLQIADWVDITLLVDDLLVGEGPHHVINAIDCVNVREESVA